MSSQKFLLIIFLTILTFLIPCPTQAMCCGQNIPWAKSETRIFLDEPTVLKGYTVIVGENDFKLGIRDKAISQPATVVIRKLNEIYVPDGPTLNVKIEETNLERVSDAWEFDFLSEPRIGILNKPLYVAIKNPTRKDENGNTIMNRKVMHFWDGTAKKWKPLPGINDLENNLTRAVIHLPYAILAVFEIPDEYEAWASWYPDNLTPSSSYSGASNNHPLGSYIKVCRLDNLAKCVKIKVVSEGPYIEGMIVDLTKSAFREIGNPSGGVVAVRVTSLSAFALK